MDSHEETIGPVSIWDGYVLTLCVKASRGEDAEESFHVEHGTSKSMEQARAWSEQRK
jgi:hypothetical protein